MSGVKFNFVLFDHHLAEIIFTKKNKILRQTNIILLF